MWSQIYGKVAVIGFGLLSKNIAKKYQNMKLSTIFGGFRSVVFSVYFAVYSVNCA